MIGRSRKAALVALALLIAGIGSLAPARQSEAVDPLVTRGIFVFIKSIKRATVDRAEAIGAVNASRDETLEELEQRRQVADYYVGRGWITPDQRDTVAQQLDELAEGVEDLARRERQIVRHDSKFTRALADNLRAEARLSAPQILVKAGVPEIAARVAGAAIQGEKPLTAVLDIAIAKVTGGAVVDPAEDPLADLKAQVASLQEATDALRGTSKAKIAAELLGVQDALERISGLPLPQQEAELGSLRRAIQEAEGTLAAAGAVRDEWLPRWMGPGNERFARDGKWQAIYGELERTAQSRIEGALAAGMAATNEDRLADALRAAGQEVTDEAIANLRSALARATAEAWAAGERPRAAELIERILGEAPIETPEASPTAAESPTAEPTEEGTATAEASPTAVATPTDTATPRPTSTPTRTPTTAQTATPTPVPPTATPTPSVLANRSLTANFNLSGFASTLALSFNFQAGTFAGSLSGGRSQVLPNECRLGGQLIDTAQATETSTFMAGLSGTIAPNGGPFSSPADIKGTTVYVLTKPFTHPNCLAGNQLPPSTTFSGFGSVSGVVPADGGPISFSVNTSVGNFSN